MLTLFCSSSAQTETSKSNDRIKYRQVSSTLAIEDKEPEDSTYTTQPIELGQTQNSVVSTNEKDSSIIPAITDSLATIDQTLSTSPEVGTVENVFRGFHFSELASILVSPTGTKKTPLLRRKKVKQVRNLLSDRTSRTSNGDSAKKGLDKLVYIVLAILLIILILRLLKVLIGPIIDILLLVLFIFIIGRILGLW